MRRSPVRNIRAVRNGPELVELIRDRVRRSYRHDAGLEEYTRINPFQRVISET